MEASWLDFVRVLGFKLRAKLTNKSIIWPLVDKLAEIAKILKNRVFFNVFARIREPVRNAVLNWLSESVLNWLFLEELGCSHAVLVALTTQTHSPAPCSHALLVALTTQTHTDMTTLRVIWRFRGREKSTQTSHRGLARDSQSTHTDFKEDSQRIHRGLAEDSQRTHRGLTEDIQRTHRGPTAGSQRTRRGLPEDSQRTHRGISEDP